MNSAPFKRGETEVQIFWQGIAQNSSSIRRCTFLARRSAKLIANFSATMVTSLPSFSLSLYLSLSHRMYLTHNIGSASALPIIYKSSVRPLGFVPATIQPKSRANPVLRLCLPLALIDNDFLLKGCLCKSSVFFCFFTHCIGCSAALSDKLDLDFFRQAFCLSLPFFHAQEIDDWRPKFRFRLWWPLID